MNQAFITRSFIALSVCALLACAHPSTNTPPAKAAPTTSTTQPSAPKLDYAAAFLGVWSNDNYPIVEISRRNDGSLFVREFYGKRPSDNKGTAYPAVLKSKQIVAQADAKLFYKHELPTFTLLPNGKLKFDSGVGPVELSRSTQPMPKAQYSPPHWTD